jgi:hypothetical protein
LIEECSKRNRFNRKDEEFRFGHINFKMYIGYSVGKIK